EFYSKGGVIKDQYVDESVNRFISDRFQGDRDKFLAHLSDSGMTLNQFRETQRKQIAVQALRSQQSGGGPEKMLIMPWEKKKKYEEIKSEFSTSGTPYVRIISMPKITPEKTVYSQKSHVESIRRQAASGSSFSSLAKKYSADSFADKGGYIGSVKKLPNKHIHMVANETRTGGVSDLIDDGPFWRIIKVDSRSGGKTPSYDEIEDEVEQRLMMEKRQKGMDSWLKKLRRDANVRIF
ncbi:MAG: peptidylprolyl isomerase, partial [Verrucomicrobiota bacterium]